VRKVAREGQQSGVVANELVKVVPREPMSCLVSPMTRSEARSWSSVMTTTTFGAPGSAAGAAPVPSPSHDSPRATPLAASAIAAPHAGLMRRSIAGQVTASRGPNRWYRRRMISRRRWLAGWGLLSLTYLSLAVVRVLSGGDVGAAVVYLVAAAVTFGFAAAVIPFVVPRRSDDGDDDSSDGGPGPGGDEPEPPPWWPDFERDFRRHTDGQGGTPGGAPPRERAPA